jgi:hypothetical protein
MVPQLTSRATVSRQGVAAENHAVLARLDGEDAQVEQLVVQSTQGQPVGLDVRPANVMPLDVCRFKSGSTSENVDNLGKPRWTRPRVSNSSKGLCGTYTSLRTASRCRVSPPER